MEHIDRAYLSELKEQGDYVGVAIKLVDQGLKKEGDRVIVWFALNSLISSLATMGQIVWPTQNRKGSFKRAERLREIMGVDTPQNEALIAVRNALAHVDERIDKWARDSKNKNIIEHVIGPRNAVYTPDPHDIFRWFDPHEDVLLVHGDRVDLQAAIVQAKAIYETAQQLLNDR